MRLRPGESVSYHLSAVGKLHRVVDGDTIELRDVSVTRFIDGKSETAKLKWTIPIRLLGMNSPETRGQDPARGFAAKEYMQRLIRPGQSVYVEAAKDADNLRDLFSFARPMGYAFRQHDGLDLGKAMIQAGYAEARE